MFLGRVRVYSGVALKTGVCVSVKDEKIEGFIALDR